MVKRFLFDYDQTIADTQTLRLAMVNRRFNTFFDAEDFKSWRSEDLMTEEESAYMWGPECFLSESFQASCPPIPGAILGIQKLYAVGHTGMVVSDRPADLFEVTRDWLDRQGLDTVRLLFTHHKHSLSTSRDTLTKYQAAHRYRLTHIIEDAPHHAEMFASKPYIKQIYLLDQPYNRDVSHEKILRVFSWDEIVEHVLADDYS